MTAATSSVAAPPNFATALQRLYFTRFAFAVIWAGLLAATATTKGLALTALLVIYPLFDAAAVLWQLRAEGATPRAKTTEWINVAVSVAVAIALGIASSISIAAARTVWGIWAIGAGIPQLITAIGNRRAGGQVPQMLSGGLSVLVGAAFLAQGLSGAGNIAGVAGYATVGAIFFLISAIRLTIVLRKGAK